MCFMKVLYDTFHKIHKETDTHTNRTSNDISVPWQFWIECFLHLRWQHLSHNCDVFLNPPPSLYSSWSATLWICRLCVGFSCGFYHDIWPLCEAYDFYFFSRPCGFVLPAVLTVGVHLVQTDLLALLLPFVANATGVGTGWMRF